MLKVLDERLADRPWIMGDELTIADIATFPWIANLVGFYDAGELVDFDKFANVGRALTQFSVLPAVLKGMRIPASGVAAQ